MIVARVAAPDTPDRFFRIEPGPCTIGSDLECNVVLLDGPILPHHLTLHASEDAVEVEMPEDARAALEHVDEDRISALRGGSRIKWGAGDRLHIEGIVIELEGIAPTARGTDVAHAAQGNARALVRLGAAAVLMLVPAGVGLGLVTHLGASDSSSAPQDVSEVPVAWTPDQVRQRLEALGARAGTIERHGDVWRATFYAADSASKARLAERLAALDIALKPTIYVDEDLKEAARITLANVSSGVKVEASQGGRLVLSAAALDAQAGIRSALLRDVPGIAEVAFQTGERVDLNAIRANITGLWHGRYPYVVLSDHTVVRPGQELGGGTTLVAVTATHLLIKVGDVETKVDLP